MCVNVCFFFVLNQKLEGKLGQPDGDNKFPVDIAYEKGHYKLFRHLISAIKFNKDELDLGRRLHGYFEDSVYSKNKSMSRSDSMIVLEAIIASDWYRVCFDNCYCTNVRQPIPVPCKALCTLIRRFPETACAALDRHITLEGHDEVHSFIPFEYIYYDKTSKCMQGI